MRNNPTWRCVRRPHLIAALAVLLVFAVATPATASEAASSRSTQVLAGIEGHDGAPLATTVSPRHVEATVEAGTDTVKVHRRGADVRSVRRSGSATFFTSDDGLVDDIVRVGDDGVSFATLIRSADAPTTFTYEVDGVGAIVPTDAGDGSLLVLDEADEVVGLIDAPWAVDARGRTVKTRYETAGTTIVQHVDHAGAAYPVLADPKIHLGLFLHIVLTASEVRSIVNNLGGAYQGAATVAKVMCALLAKAGPFTVAACVGIITIVANQLWSSLVTAKKNGQCLDLAFSPLPPYALAYWKRISATDKLCK